MAPQVSLKRPYSLLKPHDTRKSGCRPFVRREGALMTAAIEMAAEGMQRIAVLVLRGVRHGAAATRDEVGPDRVTERRILQP